MTGIRRAQAALEDAKRQAKKLVADARLELGREIVLAREAGVVQQKNVADELKLTREQVRRLEVAAKLASEQSSSDSSGS